MDLITVEKKIEAFKKIMQSNRLGGGRRRVYPFSESAKILIMISLYKINNNGGYTPSPTRLLSPQRYIERRPHDAAEGTCLGRTKLGVSLVTYIAYTTRSMPSAVLVSCRSAGAHELPLGFYCSSIRFRLISDLFLFYGQNKKIGLFTYKRRNQLKMLQELQSCTRAEQAGMWILRVSTRP